MGWKVKANDRPYHHLPEFEKKVFLCIKKIRYSVSSAVYMKLLVNGLTQRCLYPPSLLVLIDTNPEHIAEHRLHTLDKEQDV